MKEIENTGNDYGIQETLDIVQFLTVLANAIVDSLSDGTFNFLDWSKFFALVPQLSPAINGIQDVPKELGDLNDEERALLKKQIADSLRLNNPITEELAIKGADLAFHFAGYVGLIIKLKNQKAAAQA